MSDFEKLLDDFDYSSTVDRTHGNWREARAALLAHVAALTKERDDAHDILKRGLEAFEGANPKGATLLDFYAHWKRQDDAAIHRLESDLAKAREALAELVAVNEAWNADVARIIGRPPEWNDSYLAKAKSALTPGGHDGN